MPCTPGPPADSVERELISWERDRNAWCSCALMKGGGESEQARETWGGERTCEHASETGGARERKSERARGRSCAQTGKWGALAGAALHISKRLTSCEDAHASGWANPSSFVGGGQAVPTTRRGCAAVGQVCRLAERCESMQFWGDTLGSMRRRTSVRKRAGRYISWGLAISARWLRAHRLVTGLL